MNVMAAKLLKIGLIGCGLGFMFAFAAILLGIGQPNSLGQRSAIGNLFCWLSWPLGWLAEFAAKRQIIARENMPLFIIGTCVYWSVIGGAFALLLSFVTGKMLRRA